MTYSAFDKSSANGQPVELLEIQYGEDDSQIVRTTSGDRDVTVAGKLTDLYLRIQRGSDLEFRGGFNVPSLMFDAVAIAGK